MLERKRLAKTYQVVPGDDDLDPDLELGEGVGPQESGVSRAVPAATMDEELDNWDENAEDAWDEDEQAAGTGTDSVEGEGPKTPSASSAGDLEPETKKRAD